MATTFFTADSPKTIMRQTTWWFVSSLIVCFGSGFVLYVVSLIDPALLVPVSTANLLQAIPWTFFCYFAGIGLVHRLSSLRNRFLLFTVIFLLRVVTGFALAFLFQYDDERAFHEAGVAQMYGLFSWDAGTGYYHLVNMIYAIFWPNILLPKALNSLWGALLPFFAYDLGERLFGDSKAAWRSFLFAAFLPPLVLFSAVNLKEMPTAFLLVLTVWFLTVPRWSAFRKMIGVTISVGALYWLRGAPWAAVDLTGVVAYPLLGETWRLRHLMRLNRLPKLVALGLVAVIVALFFLEPIREIILRRSTEERYYTQQVEGSSATIMQFIDLSNILSPTNFLLLFLRGLYSPSPMRILYTPYHLDTVIEAFSMMVWYLLFPLAISGFLAGRHRGAVIACGLTALAVLIMATTGVAAGSDPYRHRMATMGLVCALAGGGYQTGLFPSSRWIFWLWWVGALLFTAAWLIFKV
jgi:hypothetical protein